jgi:hypothetical protein
MKNFPPSFTNWGARHVRTLVISLVAVLTVFLLAAGLSGLELLPGEPNAFGFVFQSIRFQNPGVEIGDEVLSVIRIIYLIGLVLLPIWLVYVIVNPQARKRFIRDMITFGSMIFLLLMLTSYLNERRNPEEEGQFDGFSGLTQPPAGEISAGDFGTGPTEELMWIASVLVALVVVGFLALVVWLVWRSRRQQDSTLERIAQEVQFALDELQAGGDLRNVVIRCYSEMVQALREQRGILRNVYLTPREFEDTLHGLGFPPEPVHQLTHLFEAVRYGHKPITRREELVAKDSLTAILDACRSNG